MPSDTRIQPLTIYPTLDLTLPSVPQRSHLYSLVPIGVNMPYVESLTSYICRVASAHSISFGSFFEYLIVPSLRKPYLISKPKVGPASTLMGTFQKLMKNINGTGKISRDWVELIEILTLRRDLRFLTFTSLSGVIPHWNLLRIFQAWCPMCYEEMNQYKKIIYQPLSWAIALVDMCTRHRTPLVDRCPHCCKQLPILNRRVYLGYCPRCGNWLGETANNQLTAEDLTDEEISWRLFLAMSIEELLASLPNIDGLVTKETVIASLHKCASISTGGVWGRFAKLIKISHSTVQGWYQGKVKPPLSSLLRICYCLDLSLTEFLKGIPSVRGNGSNVRELPDISCPAKVARTSRILNYEKIRIELESLLNLETPISFAEASRRLKINVADLYRKFPELYIEITARYKKYRQDFIKSRRIEFEDEVRRAVIHLYAQGIYVSPRPVAKYLNKPSYFGRRDVAAIIRKTREELDIGKGRLVVN